METIQINDSISLAHHLLKEKESVADMISFLIYPKERDKRLVLVSRVGFS